MTDHICASPIANGWVPGMLWTCLGCGDVWVLMGNLTWERTDLNLHSRTDGQIPSSPAPPLEYGVRIASGTGAVDMRCEDQNAAENLVDYTNRVGNGETNAALIWRQLGSTSWQSANTAAGIAASQIPVSPGWPTS